MGKLKLGPEYARLEELIGARAKAVAANESNLKAEISAHDGSHAYGRHGAQTGWENQLIRAVTGITPDQTFDPTGVQGTFRSWSTDGYYNSIKSLDSHGAVIDCFMSLAHYPLASEFRTGGGDVAGGFYSPEAHQRALHKANAQLAALTNDQHHAAHWKDTTTGKTGWFPITSVVIAVSAANDRDFYGLGFARRAACVNQTRDFVLRLIEAYQTGQTGANVFPEINGPGAMRLYKFNWIALRKNKALFASLEELCGFLEVDIVIQKGCTVVFRRSYDFTSKLYGPWRRITMYPNDVNPGWIPQLPKAFEQVQKTELIAKGMSRETKKYTWTGTVADRSGANKRTLPVPGWA